MSGEIFGCHNQGRVCYWNLVCRDKDAAQYPTMQKIVTTTEYHLPWKVNKTEVWNPALGDFSFPQGLHAVLARGGAQNLSIQPLFKRF